MPGPYHVQRHSLARPRGETSGGNAYFSISVAGTCTSCMKPFPPTCMQSWSSLDGFEVIGQLACQTRRDRPLCTAGLTAGTANVHRLWVRQSIGGHVSPMHTGLVVSPCNPCPAHVSLHLTVWCGVSSNVLSLQSCCSYLQLLEHAIAGGIVHQGKQQGS